MGTLTQRGQAAVEILGVFLFMATLLMILHGFGQNSTLQGDKSALFDLNKKEQVLP